MLFPSKVLLPMVMSFKMMRINFIWIFFISNIYERSLDHSCLKTTRSLTLKWEWKALKAENYHLQLSYQWLESEDLIRTAVPLFSLSVSFQHKSVERPRLSDFDFQSCFLFCLSSTNLRCVEFSVRFALVRRYTTSVFCLGRKFLWGLAAFCIFSAINKRFY